MASLGGYFPQAPFSTGGSSYGGWSGVNPAQQVNWLNNQQSAYQPGGHTTTHTTTNAGTSIDRTWAQGGYGPSMGQTWPQQQTAQTSQTAQTTQSQPSSQRSWYDPARYFLGKWKSNTSAPTTPQGQPQSFPSSTPGFSGYTPHSQTTDPISAAQQAAYQALLSQQLQAQGGSLCDDHHSSLVVASQGGQNPSGFSNDSSILSNTLPSNDGFTQPNASINLDAMTGNSSAASKYISVRRKQPGGTGRV